MRSRLSTYKINVKSITFFDNDMAYKTYLFYTYFKNLLNKVNILPKHKLSGLLIFYLRYKVKDRIYREIENRQDKTEYFEVFGNQGNYFIEHIDRILQDDELYQIISMIVNSEIDEYLNTYKSFQKSSVFKRINDVKNIFKLDEVELRVLEIFYLKDIDPYFSTFIEDVADYFNLNNEVNIIDINLISIILNVSKSEIINCFKNSSKLVKYRIIDIESRKDFNPEISMYIDGFSEKPLTEIYYSKFNGNCLDIKYFNFSQKDIDILIELLKNKNRTNGLKILFYGKPGTGKTELARSICRFLNYDTYEINSNNNIETNYNESKDKKTFRSSALYACENVIDCNNSVIVIDEADDMLNSSGNIFSFFLKNDIQKSDINILLDNTKATQIWITNRYNDIDESTLRRFDFSLGFKELNFNQRVVIWKNIITKYKLDKMLTDIDIDFLADKFNINAGVIENACKNCRRIYHGRVSKDKIYNIINATIKSYLETLDKKTDYIDSREAGSKNYSIDGLNINENIDKNLLILKEFSNYLEKNQNEVRNMNILMSGPPGTGKTELAKYISRFLKKRLIVKKASDLLDPFVGINEKNIRAAFDEAQKNNSILFIDEIDSFLFSRESTSRSWEVSLVNELLTNIENFKGIFIAATNYLDKIDFAALRRFNIKLSFDYLTSDGIMIFYKRFFGELILKDPETNELAKLLSIKYLTPGDFKVVYQKYYFFEKNKIDHETLITELNNEVYNKKDKLKGKIGF